MITMNEMVKAVTKKRDFEQRLYQNAVIHLTSERFKVEGVGVVWCYLQLVQGVRAGMTPHLRKAWELNDKPISAAKLAELIQP